MSNDRASKVSQTDEEVDDLPFDEEVEEEENEEEYWSLYHSDSFISGPLQSDPCTIQEDILQFHFSFGYDCRKYFNLTTPDPDTVLFASGNFINFFDVPSQTISFRRSALGGGIGHIKANPHPEFNHVAVAENGNVPLIIIYEWPTLDIVCVLKGGSTKIYSHLDFSPDGLLLVSQGGEPDYLITIWNWPKRRILLRTKSNFNDVYRVKFSPFVPGQLTTCGISHIKFWKMAQTFTGLKLQGELGRFGKTEFSDILGMLPMPDEKVVSGCVWGNILVWDAGLIKLEVFRTLRRKCHEGPIVQISYKDGELTTVAMDGHVKVWWYEKIDQADPPDDDRVIQIEPTYDFYTPGLMLMCIRKRYPDPNDTTFFGQDGNGGIWLIDLNTEQTPKQSIQLYKCHAGKVAAISACPWGPYLVSLGEDGRIYLYAYLNKELIFEHQYPAKGTCMIWVPTKLVPSGDELIMGFDDGSVRVSVLTITEVKVDLKVVESKKPHDKPVTKITINPTNEVLVSGSEDCTIFLFKIVVNYSVELIPIGYIKVPNPVTCFTWHCSEVRSISTPLPGVEWILRTFRCKNKYLKIKVKYESCGVLKTPFKSCIRAKKSEGIVFSNFVSKLVVLFSKLSKGNADHKVHYYNILEDELLAGCLRGEIVQLTVVKEPQIYTRVSYLLQIEPKMNKFTTYKAQIRRDIKIAEIQAKKDKKVAKKRIEMEKLKAENPGLDIDEQVFLADSETEEELEPLHIPDIPNRILWMQSTNEGSIWLSMGGYDAGYIYEYKIDQKSEVPYFFRMVDDADDVEISSYVYNHNKKYLIFAMQGGQIRVNKLMDEDYRNLSDYWLLSMHDNQNGFVPNMCFSYDEKFFFTGGYDGNVFSYTFHPEDEEFIPQEDIPTISERTSMPVPIEDESNYDKLSIERASLKKEQDRIDQLAAAHREEYRAQLRGLRDRFYKLLRRNSKLLPSQVIPPDRLEVDRRVTEYLHQKLEDEMALVKRKLAFDVQKAEMRMVKLKRYFIDGLVYNPIIVTGLNREIWAKMLRENKLTLQYEEMSKLVEEKIVESQLKGRPAERPPPISKITKPKKTKDLTTEYFLVNISPSVLEHSSNNKLVRLLQKYRDRKLKWEKREDEWVEFLEKKPVPGVNHPDDDASLATGKATIGDYKLKSDPQYRPPLDQRENTLKKYRELLLARKRQFLIRTNYNDKVYALRENKQKLRAELEQMKRRLEEIQEEIPDELRKTIPTVQPSLDSEFPERALEINVQLEVEDVGTKKTLGDEEVVLPPIDLDHHEKNIISKSGKNLDGKSQDVAVLDFQTLCNFSKNQKKETLWEADIRKRRLERKIFEQDEIIHLMQKKITKFDDHVETLSTEKHYVDVNAKVMDIFMITLQQELIILREFEALENNLQGKVNLKNSEVLDMRDVINDINNQIVDCNQDIEKAHERIKEMQTTFTQAILDNKFFDFLRKVYRKKYKPPKIHKDNESSSESSSSSSSESSTESEDEGKSIDSRDFGIIKQDLNVCPKGCDPAVYDYTVKMRSERHKIEIKIKDIMKNIDILKKYLGMHNKKVVVIERDLKKCENELEAFQREKQERLNKVRCTIVLHLHQLQHLTPDSKSSGIKDTLVFSKAKLSRLYKRVEELQDETASQIRRHRLNVKHYTRMTTDCKYMARTIKNLQENITQTMKIKFGKVVDINEIDEAMLKRTFGKDDLHDLEEVILKKIIHDLRLCMMDIKGMYVEELKLWNKRIIETQKEFTYALRNNTSQQELLSFLVKEKNELAQTLISQEKKKQHLEGVEDVLNRYGEEISKMETIVEEQNQQIQELKDEIKLLRTKGMLLQPRELKRDEPSEEETKIWEDIKLFDEVIEEEDPSRKPFSTDIIIPTTLAENSDAVATEIVNEMLQALNICLSKKSNENLVKEILTSVLHGVSMTDLIQTLVQNLPIEPDDEQLAIIEATAEQLYVVGEPDTLEEDKFFCSKEILEDILEEALVMAGDSETVISQIFAKLLEQVPIDYLTKQSNIEYLQTRLSDLDLKAQLRRDRVLQIVHNKDVRAILESVVQDVFDKGVDLLYYIKDH